MADLESKPQKVDWIPFYCMYTGIKRQRALLDPHNSESEGTNYFLLKSIYQSIWITSAIVGGTYEYSKLIDVIEKLF